MKRRAVEGNASGGWEMSIQMKARSSGEEGDRCGMPGA
jgi:hypothetical protein